MKAIKNIIHIQKARPGRVIGVSVVLLVIVLGLAYSMQQLVGMITCVDPKTHTYLHM